MIVNLVFLIILTIFTAGFLAIITIPAVLILIIKYKKNLLTLSDKSVILTTGWLNTSHVEITHSKINSVTVKQEFISNMCCWGDIAVLSGNDVSGEMFKGIDNPKSVKDAIMRRVDKI